MAAIETPTKIGVISDSLVLIGEQPTTNINDNRYGVTVGAALFEVLYESELASNRWRFAMKKKMLSQVVGTPLNVWQYIYQLPSDCLLPIGIIPIAAYEIYADKLYTNQSSVELDYMFKPDISEVPPYFRLLLTYSLAKNMIKPVTESDEGVKVMEMHYNIQRNKAMFADAQARPSTTIPDAFTSVRTSRAALR